MAARDSGVQSFRLDDLHYSGRYTLRMVAYPFGQPRRPKALTLGSVNWSMDVGSHRNGYGANPTTFWTMWEISRASFGWGNMVWHHSGHQHAIRRIAVV